MGSGRSHSVIEVIKTCYKLTGIKPNILIKKQRKYDTKILICKIDKAKKYLKWKPNNSNLKNIVKDEIWWFKNLNKQNIIRKFIY